MSVTQDAINALNAVRHDPEIDLDFDENEILLDALGVLAEHQ